MSILEIDKVQLFEATNLLQEIFEKTRLSDYPINDIKVLSLKIYKLAFDNIGMEYTDSDLGAFSIMENPDLLNNMSWKELIRHLSRFSITQKF